MSRPTAETIHNHVSTPRIARLLIVLGVVSLLPLLMFSGSAVAQTDGSDTGTNATGVTESFCETSIATTIRNLFQLIQFGGPLVGGVLALGATVTLPFVRRSDLKREMKDIRNQGLVWGVIVAPLGTVIVQFLLNNVVAGGASCGF